MQSDNGSKTYCDLTQSYSATGGGIRTYIDEKRKFILENTEDRHCLIVPGEKDVVHEDGPLITIEIASPKVPASPNYRLLLRSNAVIKALRLAKPDLVECLDAYNLPWAALKYRADHPKTVLVAGYRTDFPEVYIHKYGRRYTGNTFSSFVKVLAYKYAANLYKRFDAFYTLSQTTADLFTNKGIPSVHVLSLGVDPEIINPARRDISLRRKLGMSDIQPLLVYAGRIDGEKNTRIVIDAFKKLPAELGAGLVMLGDGNERNGYVKECAGMKAHFPGFMKERSELSRYLASSDIYVSGMEDETLGISIIEAQSAGLPVVGVKAGAMIDRVPPFLGELGPPGDSAAMAANIVHLWENGVKDMSDRARNHVLDNFSWKKTFHVLFKDIYSEAFATRGTHCGPLLELDSVSDQAAPRSSERAA